MHNIKGMGHPDIHDIENELLWDGRGFASHMIVKTKLAIDVNDTAYDESRVNALLAFVNDYLNRLRQLGLTPNPTILRKV